MNIFKEGDIEVKVFESSSAIEIEVHATNQIKVDRRYILGWLFGPTKKAMAARLVQCIKANKAFDTYTIEKDIAGKTYISAATTGFFSRGYINEELLKLGF